MGNIFSGSEIVEIGIQIEKNGFDFYATMAAQTKSAKAKEIFQYLAEQEQHHREVFEKILSSVAKFEPQGLDADQYYAYMNSLASESVFTQKDKGKEIAKKTKNDKEAIEIGIKAENDSIVFYQGMKKVAPGYDQKVIDEVVAQEEEHLKQLAELKKTS